MPRAERSPYAEEKEMVTWDEHNRAILQRLLQSGQSFSEVAKMLGLTRDQISGLSRRLKNGWKKPNQSLLVGIPLHPGLHIEKKKTVMHYRR